VRAFPTFSDSISEAIISRRVLLIGIAPFGKNSINSSWEACRLVAAEPPPGVEVAVELLPCVFHESIAALRKAINRFGPEVVIATGQGGSRPDITVECVAINLDDAAGADNKGNQPIDEPIIPGGPAAYFSSLPVKACTEALLKAGIPASVSHTAGTFLCNHVAYGLAHLIATERPDIRGGFVHVPFTPAQAADRIRRRPPSMASTTAAEALRVVITTALATTHDHQEHSARLGPIAWLTRNSRP
jgi:pyroglutamyl-peptidase